MRSHPIITVCLVFIALAAAIFLVSPRPAPVPAVIATPTQVVTSATASAIPSVTPASISSLVDPMILSSGAYTLTLEVGPAIVETDAAGVTTRQRTFSYKWVAVDGSENGAASGTIASLVGDCDQVLPAYLLSPTGVPLIRCQGDDTLLLPKLVHGDQVPADAWPSAPDDE